MDKNNDKKKLDINARLEEWVKGDSFSAKLLDFIMGFPLSLIPTPKSRPASPTKEVSLAPPKKKAHLIFSLAISLLFTFSLYLFAIRKGSLGDETILLLLSFFIFFHCFYEFIKYFKESPFRSGIFLSFIVIPYILILFAALEPDPNTLGYAILMIFAFAIFSIVPGLLTLFLGDKFEKRYIKFPPEKMLIRMFCGFLYGLISFVILWGAILGVISVGISFLTYLFSGKF